VLRIKFCGGRKFNASKTASSPSAKPLAVRLKDDTEQMTSYKNGHRKNINYL